jgi:glycosyltransferase involved in cell wall biosynthesis
MLPIIPDVVFIPNPHRTPVSHDLPLVSVVHDLGFERFPEFLTFRRRMSHQLLRNPQLLLQNSDHVIAVSQHTKEDVLRLYGVDPNRISVVYSGLHTNSGMPTVVDIQALIRRHHLPEKFLLFIGTMEPRKNIMSVVQAFDAIAHGVPQHLVIAGEQGWKSHELHRALAASAYRDRIHLIGFIPEEEKSALYAAADLFVYPSFYEGFGFPPLEALVAGTPVVTSFNSSLPEVVGKWATLIDPYNTPQLAAVLQEYLLTPTRVPISVRKEIQETYSWERAAKQTISVLEGVV